MLYTILFRDKFCLSLESLHGDGVQGSALKTLPYLTGHK